MLYGSFSVWLHCSQPTRVLICLLLGQEEGSVLGRCVQCQVDGGLGQGNCDVDDSVGVSLEDAAICRLYGLGMCHFIGCGSSGMMTLTR